MNPTNPAGTPGTPDTVTPCTRPSVRDDLKAYADGELSLLARLRVRAHLSRCGACQQEINEMQTITRDLENADAPTEGNTALSPDLRARLLTGIADVQTTREAFPDPADAPVEAPRPLWRRQPLLVFGGGGGAALASAVVFTMLYSQAQQGPTAGESAGVSYGNGVATRQVTNGPAPASALPAALPANEAMADKAAASAAPALPQSAMAPPPPGDLSGNAADGVAMARGRSASGPASAIRAKQSIARYAPRPVPSIVGSVSGGGSSAVAEMDATRQVHREASIGVAVDQLEATSDKIEEMVKAGGGYVASNNLSTDSGGYKSADLSLRVPTADFDATLLSLGKLGEVVSKNITGEDITEKVSDSTSAEQVLVNEVQETQRKLATQTMSERRTGVKEAELRDLRIRLAQTRARLGLLRKMASLSTINVSLTQKAKKAATQHSTPGIWTDMRETNRSAALAFQSAIRVPLVMLVWVLAFSPLWVPLLIAYRYTALKSAAGRLLNKGQG